jgi:hypothetical protein
MGKMIQVRDVPPELHEELMRRARAQGQTLTSYIQEILEREVAFPDRHEVLQRIYTRDPVKLEAAVSDLVRAERGGQDQGEAP